MKNIYFLLTALFGGIANINAQILPFIELPDSLNPFSEENGAGLNTIDIEDFSGDGIADVILSNTFCNLVGSYFEGDGQGNFSFMPIGQSPLGSIPPIGLYDDSNSAICHDTFFKYADFDNDGDTDVAVIARYSEFDYYCNCSFYWNEVIIYSNIGQGTFEVLPFDYSSSGNFNNRGFTDIDEDGDMDLIAFHSGFSKYIYFDGLFLHRFDSDILEIEEGEEMAEFEVENPNIQFFDIDQDGDEDAIMTSNNSSSQITFQEKSGPEVFELSEALDFQLLQGEQINTRVFDIGDLNNDGFFEILLWDSQLEKYRLFSQDVCPDDPDKLAPGDCGCGTEDLDGDFNGISDCLEDPLACETYNFSDAPEGLYEDQTINNGNRTRLFWDHYSDATDGCILNGGMIESLNTNEPFSVQPVQVLIQGINVSGSNGLNYSASLGADATFQTFDPSQYPNGTEVSLTPGETYKWQVRCGCIIDNSLPLPDKLAMSNLVLSPWSDYSAFTNLVQGVNAKSLELSPNMDEIIFYPNPFSNELRFDLKTGMAVPNEIQFSNAIGQILKKYQNLDARDRSIILNTSELSNGIYFVTVFFDQERISTKMIKQ